MQDEILKNFDQHIFYHGTSYYGVENIYNKRFYAGAGLLGGGVYITSNWLIAIWTIHYHGFWRDEDGGAILQINISKGTRILNSAIEPDRKCLQYLHK